MRTIVGRDSLQKGDRPTSIAIGTFDGVHVGHGALIKRAVDHAEAHDHTPTVVTWDRHPAATLRPEKAPPLLTTPERKVELLEQTDIEQLVILEFDETLSRWAPEDFVKKVLVEGLGAGAVFVGTGWRFGHRATGDVQLLTELGDDLGFAVEGLELAEVDGAPVSSTRVREALSRGDMKLVQALLGRPFDFEGVVQRGDDRGRALGWPTANLPIDPAYAHPPRGVYAGRGRVEGKWWPAAINVGVNPTFGGEPGRTPMRVEAFLLDFDGDLYSRPLRLEFHERLRDERKFDDPRELSAQIARDVEATRRLL